MYAPAALAVIDAERDDKETGATEEQRGVGRVEQRDRRAPYRRRHIAIVASTMKRLCGGQARNDDACSRTNSATVCGGRPVRSAMALVIVTVLPPAR